MRIAGIFMLLLLLVSCGREPQLSLRSVPEGATVWDGDAVVGRTPCSVALPREGQRVLFLRQHGCVDNRITLEPSGKRRLPPLVVHLQAVVEPSFTVEFVTLPAGANVFIEGEYRGRTPVMVAGLRPGRSEYLLRLKDRQEVSGVLALGGSSPAVSRIEAELPSQILPYYEQLITQEPLVVHHYADLGHYLILEKKFAEAMVVFRRGLVISIKKQSEGDDYRLWSELDRVITCQYEYGTAAEVKQASLLLLDVLRSLWKEYPECDILDFYTNYITCADALNFRQEAQQMFDIAFGKWPKERVLLVMRKKQGF